jgi:hypothetical protein
VLAAHAPDLRIDAVLADPSSVDDINSLADVAATMGARLLIRQVSVGDGTARHDPLRLAAAYRDLFVGVWRRRLSVNSRERGSDERRRLRRTRLRAMAGCPPWL